MGLAAHAGCIAVGGDADFVLFHARCYSELLSRPQADRIVVRKGATVATRLPAFSELDEDDHDYATGKKLPSSSSSLREE